MIKSKVTPKLLKLTSFCLITAAVTWNGWILGWLNHGKAGYTNMSISELEVRGQHFYLLFSGLDNFSAVMMIFGVIGLISLYKYRASFWLVVMGLIIFVIAGLTFFDTSYPLDCNRYLNPVCVKDVADNNVSQTDKLHNSESRITAYATVALALSVVCWAIFSKKSLALVLLSTAILISVVVSLEILDNTGHIFADSISERIWNVMVSLDLIYIAYLVRRPQETQAKKIRS